MIALLDAPTNLGLRPPRPGAEPGCHRAPAALRAAGLHGRLVASGAVEAGAVPAGPYVPDVVPGSGRVRNEDAVVDHARRLADRLGSLLGAGHAPLVVGGDCSLLLGTGLALARRGRHAVVHIDGHTDFRHPGNSDACANLAGEDLALLVGRHWPTLADLEGRGPYVDPADTVHIGCRDDDEHLAEVLRLLGLVVPAAQVEADGAGVTADRVRAVLDRQGLRGTWLHVDVDVLDPEYLPAVDSPSPGGLSPDALVALLRSLAPAALGAQVTVFDPDLDPDGRQAALVAQVVADGLMDLGSDVVP